MDRRDHPDYADAYISYAEYADGTELNEYELDMLTNEYGDLVNQMANDSFSDYAADAYDRWKDRDLEEAKYQGRTVPLGKPMQGDVKKFKVYVKNKKGNVVKVNFGDPNMRIKKSNPARRKSFRARHRCATAKDRTSARYWSCRAW